METAYNLYKNSLTSLIYKHLCQERLSFKRLIKLFMKENLESSI